MLGSLHDAENQAVRINLEAMSRSQLEQLAWRALEEVGRLSQDNGREVRFASLMLGLLLGAALATAAFLAGTMAN